MNQAVLSLVIKAFDQAKGPLAAVKANLQGVGQAAQKSGGLIGGLKGALGALGKLGFAAMGIQALVGGFRMLGEVVAAPARAAISFGKLMTALVTGAGESTAALGQVRQGILSLAVEIGVGPEKLAEGMYMIESAGFRGAAALEVLRASAIAAKVGMASQESVANAVTSALNAYHMAGKDATKVTDLLIQTVASGKMRMDDLAGSLGTILPTAAAAHVGLDQVGAAMATMTMQGSSAAESATHLRMMMLNMQAPSTKAKNALASIGLKSTEVANTLTKQGLLAALQLVQTHLDQKVPRGSAAANAALIQIFGGVRSGQAALELMNGNLSVFEKNLAGMESASEGAGKTLGGWELIMNGAGTASARLSAGLEVLQIKFGAPLTAGIASIEGALKDLVIAIIPAAEWLGERLGEAMRTVGSLASSVVGGVQKIAGVIGGVVKVLNGANFDDVLGDFKPLMDLFKTQAVYSFGTSLQKVVSVVRVFGRYIADVVSTGYIFNSMLDGIPDALRPVATILGTVISIVRDLGKNLLDLVGGKIDLGTFLKNMGKSLSNKGPVIWNEIKKLFGRIDWKGILATAGKKLSEAWNTGIKLLGDATAWAKAEFDKIKWDEVWKTLTGIGAGLIESGLSIVEQVSTWLGTTFAGVKWAEVWAQVTTFVSTTATWLGQKLGEAWTAVKSLGANIWDKLTLKTDETGTTYRINVIKSIETWIENAWTSVKTFGADIWGKLFGATTTDQYGTTKTTVGLATTLMATLGDAVGSINWAEVWANAKQIGSDILKTALNIATAVKDWLVGVWQSIPWSEVWSGAQSVLATGVQFIGNITTELTAWLRKQFGLVSADEIYKDVPPPPPGMAGEPKKPKEPSWLQGVLDSIGAAIDAFLNGIPARLSELSRTIASSTTLSDAIYSVMMAIGGLFKSYGEGGANKDMVHPFWGRAFQWIIETGLAAFEVTGSLWGQLGRIINAIVDAIVDLLHEPGYAAAMREAVGFTIGKGVRAARAAAYNEGLTVGEAIAAGVIAGLSVAEARLLVFSARSDVRNLKRMALMGFASGTPYAPGGLAVVGERGPEIVYLPRGAQVENASRTAATLAGLRANQTAAQEKREYHLHLYGTHTESVRSEFAAMEMIWGRA